MEGPAGARFFRQTFAADSTRRFRFEHGKRIEKLEIPWLTAVVEIEGTEPSPDPPLPPSRLRADIDGDGGAERIDFEINAHFGSLVCNLPRGDDSPQSIGECQWLGMLAFEFNGRSESVCDTDTLIASDGAQRTTR